MTHLTRTTQQSIFETTVAPRKPARQEAGEVVGPVPYRAEKPFAVGPDMTPEQAANLRMANYPQYDWRDVANIEPRSRGKRY